MAHCSAVSASHGTARQCDRYRQRQADDVCAPRYTFALFVFFGFLVWNNWKSHINCISVANLISLHRCWLTGWRTCVALKCARMCAVARGVSAVGISLLRVAQRGSRKTLFVRWQSLFDKVVAASWCGHCDVDALTVVVVDVADAVNAAFAAAPALW